MLVSPMQNSGVGGIAQRQPPTPGILRRSEIWAYTLHIPILNVVAFEIVVVDGIPVHGCPVVQLRISKAGCLTRLVVAVSVVGILVLLGPEKAIRIGGHAYAIFALLTIVADKVRVEPKHSTCHHDTRIQDGTAKYSAHRSSR